jgi:hypothetical protein
MGNIISFSKDVPATAPAPATKQTRKASLFETVASAAIGYFVAITTQAIVFPLFGIYLPFHNNVIIGVIFTFVSIVRGFYVRRMFEHLRITGLLT